MYVYNKNHMLAKPLRLETTDLATNTVLEARILPSVYAKELL